jgi:hypothetical protein
MVRRIKFKHERPFIDAFNKAFPSWLTDEMHYAVGKIEKIE